MAFISKGHRAFLMVKVWRAVAVVRTSLDRALFRVAAANLELRSQRKNHNQCIHRRCTPFCTQYSDAHCACLQRGVDRRAHERRHASLETLNVPESHPISGICRFRHESFNHWTLATSFAPGCLVVKPVMGRQLRTVAGGCRAKDVGFISQLFVPPHHHLHRCYTSPAPHSHPLHPGPSGNLHSDCSAHSWEPHAVHRNFY